MIEHVVVLMLENRSFDCLLGRLYPKSADFDGLDGSESNPDGKGGTVKVWNSGTTDPDGMAIPSPDPGEFLTDMNMQIFGTATPAPGATPTMDGFVRNYASQPAKSGEVFDGKSVMHHFTPDQVPVMSALAKAFAVSDRWHASAPCQTWPNRFFVHTCTANGYENNNPVHFPYDMETVFNRFEKAGLPWKIYFNDMPQTLTLAQLWPNLGNFRLYPQFLSDAAADKLPAYSFIEPRYFTDLALPNDQHPPHVVTLGEQLIAEIYNALRTSPAWPKTLLIVTFDEHGGCFDHVKPPAATPPETPRAGQAFAFDRYGVRVPALLISPFIKPGTILRPPAGGPPFDHTSIFATLRKLFPKLGAKLTQRDAAAPDFMSVIGLDQPTNNGPAEPVKALPYAASPAEIAAAKAQPLNSQQTALAQLAAHLPTTVATGDFVPFITSYLDHLRSGATAVGTAAVHDVASATDFIDTRLTTLFSSL